jgi:hypothetical protein
MTLHVLFSDPGIFCVEALTARVLAGPVRGCR